VSLKKKQNLRVKDWTHFVTLEHKGIYSVHFFFSSSDNIVHFKNLTSEQSEIFDSRSICGIPTVYNLQWLIPLALEKTVKFPIIIDDVDGN
jgi:hypothetical protein